MLPALDLLFAAMIFVWAILLGFINVENKLYVFMFLWILLTYIVASVTAVRLVLWIMAWSLLATMFLHLFDRWVIAARIWLRDAFDNLAITRLLRHARIAAAA